LFLQVRIKSTDTSIYQSVAVMIDYFLKPLLYSNTEEPLTMDSPMKWVKNKMVILFDNTINPKYKEYCDCENTNLKKCYDLRDYIHIEIDSEKMLTQPYMTILNQTWNTPTLQSNRVLSTVSKWRLALPDPYVPPKIKGSNAASLQTPYYKANPPLLPFLKQQGCQLVPLRYYLKDPGNSMFGSSSSSDGNTNLADYEAFFNKYNTAFVPMLLVIRDM